MYSTARAGSIIIACAVLHNIMVRADYPEPLEKEIAWNVEWERRHADIILDGAAEIEMDSNTIRRNGVAARACLVREYF